MSPVAPPPRPRRGSAPADLPNADSPLPGLVATHIDKQQPLPYAPVQPAPGDHPEERQQPEREEPQTRVAVYLRDLKISRQVLRPNGTPVPRKGGGPRGSITG